VTGKQVRILVLRGGAIGDFLLTLPAIHGLRTRWPGAWVEVLGYPHIADLGVAGGVVDRVVSLDRAEIATWFSFKARLTPEQEAYVQSFDVIVSYLHDPDALVSSNLAYAGARLLVSGSPLVTEGHAADFFFKPLEALAIYPDEKGTAPRLALSGTGRSRGRAWLAARGLAGRIWALHPGSGSPAKTWPADRFVAVARHLREQPGTSCFFVAGEADEEVLPVLARALPEVPVCRGKSLVELAEILSQAHRFLGNDSGISHLAAALHVPVVALFGPTDPAQWAPRGGPVQVIRAAHGRMEEIEVPEVLAGLAAD
jgi:heptosyltransferase-2